MVRDPEFSHITATDFRNSTKNVDIGSQPDWDKSLMQTKDQGEIHIYAKKANVLDCFFFN